MAIAKEGDTISINYTGTLNDGTIFDSTVGREPLTFTIGSGQVIQGFEEAVLGMNKGDMKNVRVPVEKGYGPRSEELVIKASLSQVPPDLKPEVGQNFQLGGPDGELIVVKIIEITDEHIYMDSNPPLASKELNFEIELVGVAA